MSFTLSKYAILLQELNDSKPHLVLVMDDINEVYRFGYLDSCTLLGASTSDNVFAHTEDSNGACHLLTPVASTRNPAIDRRSSLPSASNIDPALGFKNIFVKNFVVSVPFSSRHCKMCWESRLS